MISLPPHYLVKVQFNFIKIGTWENESFLLYLDGYEIYRRTFLHSDGTKVCGVNNNWKEEIVLVSVMREHNAATLLIVMQTTLNQHANDESWGITDFVVSIEECPLGCVTCTSSNPESCQLWRELDFSWNNV